VLARERGSNCSWFYGDHNSKEERERTHGAKVVRWGGEFEKEEGS